MTAAKKPPPPGWEDVLAAAIGVILLGSFAGWLLGAMFIAIPVIALIALVVYIAS